MVNRLESDIRSRGLAHCHHCVLAERVLQLRRVGLQQMNRQSGIREAHFPPPLAVPLLDIDRIVVGEQLVQFRLDGVRGCAKSDVLGGFSVKGQGERSARAIVRDRLVANLRSRGFGDLRGRLGRTGDGRIQVRFGDDQRMDVLVRIQEGHLPIAKPRILDLDVRDVRQMLQRPLERRPVRIVVNGIGCLPVVDQRKSAADSVVRDRLEAVSLVGIVAEGGRKRGRPPTFCKHRAVGGKQLDILGRVQECHFPLPRIGGGAGHNINIADVIK